MVIVPSAKPQSLGSVNDVLAITGATLSVNVITVPPVTQVLSAFLTKIVYVPPLKPVKLPLLANQLLPLSLEYSGR